MQLHRRSTDLDRAGVTTLLISFSTQQQARQWRQETEVGFPFLLDPGRAVYRAYGLERSVRRTWTLRTLRYYFAAVVRGERLRAAQGDPHQLAGDFVIDSTGIVRLAYRSFDPTDRPSVDLLLHAIE